MAVTRALDVSDSVASTLYKTGTAFSSFRPNGRGGRITNHIVGASILALRGRDLDSGLAAVTDDTIAKMDLRE